MNSTVNRLISQSPMIVASQMLAAAEGVSVCLPVTEKSCSSRGPTIAVKAALNKIRRVPAIWSAKQRAEHIVCAACCSRPSGRPDDAQGAPRTTRVTRWIYPTVPACFPTKPDPRILTCVRRLKLSARGVRRLFKLDDKTSHAYRRTAVQASGLVSGRGISVASRIG